ncbi:RNA polymerase III largest subunit [Pelomyxa schiedti]|nr:RNA polymerase III largest subunit [Pelomyxa schiedti]
MRQHHGSKSSGMLLAGPPDVCGAILKILQVICKSCARLMLTDEEREPYVRRMTNPKSTTLTKEMHLKKLMEVAKKKIICPHCGTVNGTTKKIGALKIVHEKFKEKGRAVEPTHPACSGDFETALKFNKEIKANFMRVQDDITPMRALDLFKRMEPEDLLALDMNPIAGHPKNLILTHLAVPPISIRPSVPQDNGSNEDDLTIKLGDILSWNQLIKMNLSKGMDSPLILDSWDNLQVACGFYINADMPGVPLAQQVAKPVRGLCQRLKGKHGRFRGNLSGKRVDFSGRTVISPDPNLLINEVGVPELVARTMTYGDRVTSHNIERLRQYVLNGPDKHPGANFVVMSNTNVKIMLKIADRSVVMSKLKIGDIVERHLIDGDYVLFNRQPSLHKISIMCHKARILPWRTFRFNECVCTPYNADFDGDEMNLHVPQTEEARAEAMELMDVAKNIQTPRTGDLIVGATQDFLTTGYLLSKKDAFLNRAQFCNLCAAMYDARVNIDVPPPAIVKPRQMWTGKQIFGIMIKPNKESNILLNMECKSKTISERQFLHPCMCCNDGYVYFRNSELMCGSLDKSSLGGGGKNSIFHVLMRDYSPTVAALCMSRIAKLSARWISDIGFSIGITDVQPSSLVQTKKEVILNDGIGKCTKAIEDYKNGTLVAQAGQTPEQVLEAFITKSLSDLRDAAGKMCLGQLHWSNSPLIMALCGSKGSTINISQMIALVGQQTVANQRIQDGFLRRTLPHFELDSKIPAAKGFVANSFYTGLNPTEFFFHTMGGREGLVDTAVKTADTGYMQRRLMKTLEDLHVHYDRTVRNSLGGIVQLTYGEDNLDPAYMEAPDKPINFPSVIQHVKATNPWDEKNEAGLTPYEIDQELTSLLADKNKDFYTAAENWKRDVSCFLLGSENREPTFIKPPSLRDEIEKESSKDSKTEKVAEVKIIDGYVTSLAKIRLQYGLPAGVEPLTEGDLTELRPGGKYYYLQTTVNRISILTRRQLYIFLETCLGKYKKATAEAGTAVGAIAAQSIGEPGTQMTLKTFHFAGVAGMNVSGGVPRIKEIINASKAIPTPIITCQLVKDNSDISARIVKGRIELTRLGEITQYIKEVITAEQCYLSIKLDMQTITSLQLGLTASSVRRALISHCKEEKVKLREDNVTLLGEEKLRVFPTDAITTKWKTKSRRDALLFVLQELKLKIPNIIVTGIPGIPRAVIQEKPKKNKDDKTEPQRYFICCEGNELAAVMSSPGVIGVETASNHVIDMERVLGIEASRTTIMSEISKVMTTYGLAIDVRHLMLVGDLMTYMGQVLGITRYGLSKMKDSVLMLASFERTTDFLFDAAVHCREDDIKGVSECIIMGIPITIGTGLFKLHHSYTKGDLTLRPTILSRNATSSHKY